jgi:putative ABC transport system permease protein
MKIRNNPRFVSVLYSGDQYKRIAHHAGQVFEQVFGTPLLEHFHAIDLHSRLYAGENKMNKVFAFSAFFSLVLACISIISLSKLEMKMKYREIGIRKIFGAGGVDLLKRYLLHYVFLMSISYIASIPFTMVFVKEWLSGFAYSIKIGPGIFVLAFILVTAASLLMIIWQVMYSVKMKPLQILRYE